MGVPTITAFIRLKVRLLENYLYSLFPCTEMKKQQVLRSLLKLPSYHAKQNNYYQTIKQQKPNGYQSSQSKPQRYCVVKIPVNLFLEAKSIPFDVSFINNKIRQHVSFGHLMTYCNRNHRDYC